MVDAIMSDIDVMTWLPCSDQVSTVEGQKKIALGYIIDFIKPWGELGFGIWGVCIRDVELGALGDFIGYCGFLPEQIEGEGPEIAYAIRKSMWGKGLAVEALEVCLNCDWSLDFFNNFHRTAIFSAEMMHTISGRRRID